MLENQVKLEVELMIMIEVIVGVKIVRIKIFGYVFIKHLQLNILHNKEEI
jgi:hypothetical protein